MITLLQSLKVFVKSCIMHDIRLDKRYHIKLSMLNIRGKCVKKNKREGG